MYRIEILKQADKNLRSLPIDYRHTISQAIQNLSTNPRPDGCKKLKDTEFYRIRIGPYRVIYTIHDDILLVVILRIGHRKDIYR
ncbi:MAG: type II toxin-antitoxin system RelE/ParE family toxin [Bacteroidota bacterium]